MQNLDPVQTEDLIIITLLLILAKLWSFLKDQNRCWPNLSSFFLGSIIFEGIFQGFSFFGFMSLKSTHKLHLLRFRICCRHLCVNNFLVQENSYLGVFAWCGKTLQTLFNLFIAHCSPYPTFFDEKGLAQYDWHLALMMMMLSSCPEAIQWTREQQFLNFFHEFIMGNLCCPLKNTSEVSTMQKVPVCVDAQYFYLLQTFSCRKCRFM